MGRPDEVSRLILAGKTPTEIASDLCLNPKSVEGYLHRAIGEGLLRRSDIYFSIPRERRDQSLKEWYSEPGNVLGDMYEDLRYIEITLHQKIKDVLVDQYGDGELGWWRQGVPESVRVKCQERREKDQDDPCEPFCYSDLLDLDAILQKQWSVLKNLLHNYEADRKQLSKDLRRLNRIRNKIMHPVRGQVPDEEDFDFVHEFRNSIMDASRCSRINFA